MSTNPVPAAADRDRLIDALRGASALAVVMFHLNAIQYYKPSPAVPQSWARLVAQGYLGVAVFFVLSGFCIGQSWSKSSGAGGFFRRRFRRIYPAYFASLMLTLGGILAWKQIHGTNDILAVPATPAHIVATLLLCTDPATHFSTVNWVYWSLTNEVFYYFAMGALLWVSGALARGWSLVALHAGLSALSLGGWDLRGTPLFFVDHWNAFALGVGACLVAARAPQAPWFLVLSAVQLMLQAALGRLGRFEIAALATFGLLLLPRHWLKPGPRHPLVAMGKISYSLYLIHVPVGVYLFMRIVGPLCAGSAVRFALGQIAGLALVLACASLFYRYFERPFLSSRQASPT